MSDKRRIVIMISGGGSNMEALILASQDDNYPARVVGVISDHEDAGGLGKAKRLGIPTFAFPRKGFASKAGHEAAILECLAGLKPDFICLAGYMRLISADFVRTYQGRIINIHPSLLPLFPGLHTHERAIAAGMKVTGCTIHHVTEGMDEGPIIAQAAVPILESDTPDRLAARVLVAEHQLYRLALARLCGDKAFPTDDTSITLSLG